MPSPVQPTHHSPYAEGEKHKQLNKEIKDMVSAITHRVTNIHKSGSTPLMENEGEHGLSMVTLVGNNSGATMKSELDEKSGNPSDADGPESLSATYVNSNFQAINNSLMFGGSYHANDPGVHMDISDFSSDPHHHHKEQNDHEKKIKKKPSKLKEPSSSSSSLSSD